MNVSRATENSIANHADKARGADDDLFLEDWGARMRAALDQAPSSDREAWARDLTHWFARNGRGGGLRLLGLMGELSDRPDECGLDALAWAARGGDEASLLLAGEVCGGGGHDLWGGGPLHHWAETKVGTAGAGAQILLAFGVPPTGRDRWGMLPMHWSRDPGVWSWSMAALWSRGEPDGWMRCAGVGYEEIALALENFGLPTWIRRSTWGPRPRSRRENKAQPSSSGDSRQSLTWSAESFRVEVGERNAMIRKRCEDQNCIAQKLGIELLLNDATA